MIRATDTGDVDKPDRSTPDGLLEAYATYHREKDLGGCDDCLSEDFQFVFTPDIADSLGLPPDSPWWGKTADISSTGNTFNDPDVVLISFTLEHRTDWQGACMHARPESTYYGLCCGIEPDIAVWVKWQDAVPRSAIELTKWGGIKALWAPD